MGDSAFKMSAGTNRTSWTSEVGDTRWNTDEQIMECFAGVVEPATVTGTFTGLADAADIPELLHQTPIRIAVLVAE